MRASARVWSRWGRVPRTRQGDAEVGKYLRVTAGYTDGQGTAESVSSAVTSAVSNVNDVPTGGVTIDDTTPTEDQLLTASNTLADADGLGAITYTWQRADNAGFTAGVVTVGTGVTYAPGDAEVGKYLRVTASYTDGQGTAESVEFGGDVGGDQRERRPDWGGDDRRHDADGGPVADGGQHLADADGLGAITYTWQRADNAGFSAGVVTVGTGVTYTPGDAEAGKYLRVTASYTDGQGTAESVSSAVTSAVINRQRRADGRRDDRRLDADGGPVADGFPHAGGCGRPGGDHLHVAASGQRGLHASVVTVGTGITYTPGDAQVGKYLRVTASYTDGQGTAESVSSAVTSAVANVNDAPTGVVTISDMTPAEQQVLTAGNNLADADGLGPITYTWQRADDAAFTTGVTTVGTGSTFTSCDQEVGKYLRVTASYTDGYGMTESVSSAVTGAVGNVNNDPTGTVTINDTTPAEDQVLTASNDLADADGLGPITYTWQRADDAPSRPTWRRWARVRRSPRAIPKWASTCGSRPATSTVTRRPRASARR